MNEEEHSRLVRALSVLVDEPVTKARKAPASEPSDKRGSSTWAAGDGQRVAWG